MVGMKDHLSPHLVESSHGRFLILSLSIFIFSMDSSSSLRQLGSYISGGVQTGAIVGVSSLVGAVTSLCSFYFFGSLCSSGYSLLRSFLSSIFYAFCVFIKCARSSVSSVNTALASVAGTPFFRGEDGV